MEKRNKKMLPFPFLMNILLISIFFFMKIHKIQKEIEKYLRNISTFIFLITIKTKQKKRKNMKRINHVYKVYSH